jgi:hypothetical protein
VLPLSTVRCHILVAGPPCPPWSSAGQKRGADDDRSQVFDRVVEVIEKLSKKANSTLLAVVIEEVPELFGTSKEFNTSYGAAAVRRLQRNVAHFVWEVKVHNARTMMPLNRKRVFIRGLRKDCLPAASATSEVASKIDFSLPGPMSFSHLAVSLEWWLDPGEKVSVDMTTLTPQRRRNLDGYVAVITDMVEHGTAGTIACFEIDRRPRRKENKSTFGGNIIMNCSPGFRTRGPSLFLISCNDLSKPIVQREVFRFMTYKEKMMLMGHHPGKLDKLCGVRLRNKALGNAFPVPLIATMLIPLLESAAAANMFKKGSKSLELTEHDIHALANMAISVCLDCQLLPRLCCVTRQRIQCLSMCQP